MGIQIPGWLEPYAYLTGSEWPDGDETAMARIADHWRNSADELASLIPDLNRVRQETMSVLMGETAQAADDQFSMLFDGDYSVDKLADAMSALGDLADNTGTQIEYTKLQIITSLAIAAAEITWALAAAAPTWGASLSLIPVTQAVTMAAVRALVAALMRQIAARVTSALTRTTVQRLIREAGKEALQELAQGLGQEVLIQGFQIAKGSRDDWDRQQLGSTAASSVIGGAAAAPVQAGVRGLLGPSTSVLGGATKGALAGYTSGVAGNVAGTLGTGGELDALSIFGGAASSGMTGGIRGTADISTAGASVAGAPAAQSGPEPAPSAPGPTTGGDPTSNGGNQTSTTETASSTTTNGDGPPTSSNNGQQASGGDTATSQQGTDHAPSPTATDSAAPAPGPSAQSFSAAPSYESESSSSSNHSPTPSVASSSETATASAPPTSGTDSGPTTASDSPSSEQGGDQSRTGDPSDAATQQKGGDQNQRTGEPTDSATQQQGDHGRQPDGDAREHPRDTQADNKVRRDDSLVVGRAEPHTPAEEPPSSVGRFAEQDSSPAPSVSSGAAVPSSAAPTTAAAPANTAPPTTTPPPSTASNPSSPANTGATAPPTTPPRAALGDPAPNTSATNQPAVPAAKTTEDTATRDQVGTDPSNPAPAVPPMAIAPAIGGFGGSHSGTEPTRSAPQSSRSTDATHQGDQSQQDTTRTITDGQRSISGWPVGDTTTTAVAQGESSISGGPDSATSSPEPPTSTHRSDNTCGPDTLANLEARYGREFPLDATVTPQGVPARSIFEATGATPEITTYAQIEERLRALGPGSAAVITSSWAGDVHQGGHTYHAENNDGTIEFVDSDGSRTGWPPSWTQDAVDTVAAGYLDGTGAPVNPVDAGDGRYDAADQVGDVGADRHIETHRGEPIVTPRPDLGVSDHGPVVERRTPTWTDNLVSDDPAVAAQGVDRSHSELDYPIGTHPDYPNDHVREVDVQVGRNTAHFTVVNGNPVQAQFSIEEAFSRVERPTNELADQRRVRTEDGDDAGHLFGFRFGLDQGLDNLFAQAENFNRSAYLRMENEWAAFAANGARVEATVRLAGVDPDTGRPSEVRVRYRADDPETGNRIHRGRVVFDNEDGQKFNRLSGEEIRRRTAGPAESVQNDQRTEAVAARADEDAAAQADGKRETDAGPPENPTHDGPLEEQGQSGDEADADDSESPSATPAQGNPADARIYGPHELAPVEDPEYQAAVEGALRNPDGTYAVGADPRINDYGGLINDGGPSVRGRSNNCLDCSLSALSSFRGEPTVSAPRHRDLLPDGSNDVRSGEHSGLQRAEAWLGRGLLGFPGSPLADQFDALHQYVSDLGPGSAALVVNGWHAFDPDTGELQYNDDETPMTNGSHATVIVYPEGADGPVWWCPQTSRVSDGPPLWMTGRSSFVYFTPIEPTQGVSDAGIADPGTSAGIPGRVLVDGVVPALPVPVRLGGGDPAEPGGDGFGEGSRSGEDGARQRDGSAVRLSELVGRHGDRGVHGDEADGSQPSRSAGVSVSGADSSPTDPGDRGDGRVRDDGDVVDRSSEADRTARRDTAEEQRHVQPDGLDRGPGELVREVGGEEQSGDLAGGGDEGRLTAGEHPSDGAANDASRGDGSPARTESMRSNDLAPNSLPPSTDDAPNHHGAMETDYPDGHISKLLDLPAYPLGSLSSGEIDSLRQTGERQVRAMYDALRKAAVSVEVAARAVFDASRDLMSWIRQLAKDGSSVGPSGTPTDRTWDDAVAELRERGLDGDELYAAIAEQSIAGVGEHQLAVGRQDDVVVGREKSGSREDLTDVDKEATPSIPVGAEPSEGIRQPRFVLLADGTLHRVWASAEDLQALESRFVAADAWLAKRGLSRADVQPLLVLPTERLDPGQQQLVRAYRHEFPDADGEILQKIIDRDQADSRLMPGKKPHPANMTGGSVTVARDTRDLTSPASIYEGLALNYDNTDFAPDDAAVVAMRFIAEDATVLVPDKRLAELLGRDEGYDPGYPYPFTGTGFTASEVFTVPEYFLERATKMNSGAEMYQINADGTETLLAVLKDEEWVRVVGHGQ